MKDFLERLEIGENKIKLSKEEIKAILAEHGKTVTTETDKIKNDMQRQIDDKVSVIDDLKEQLKNAPQSSELEDLKNKIADYEKKETQRQQQEEADKQDRILTNNIMEALGDKKFVNDYTKNSIIADIKTALKDNNNTGKSAKDIFESITKDRNDIFENPNKMEDGIPGTQTDEPGTQKGSDTTTGIKLNPLFRKF